MDQAHIRNFSIIAHIDHGKSTLADRILELTHTVQPRDMRAQVLDSMDLERERGITIKAQAVRVFYTAGDPDGPPRALIFDSEFDQYRGVVAYIRVVDGTFRKGEAIRAMAAGTEADIDDIGCFSPQMMPTDQLAAGEVGYLITGLKDVTQLRVGDTLTTRARAGAPARAAEASEPLPGYREVKPMVFCGLFPIDSDAY